MPVTHAPPPLTRLCNACVCARAACAWAAAIAPHIVPVPMAEGDVVLVDSYATLHGRETFEGPRQHGVLWLTTPPAAADDDGGGGGGGGASALSGVVNRLAVKGGGGSGRRSADD